MNGSLGRREFLLAAGCAGVLAACARPVAKPDTRPVALVYRGPASTPGCPEAVAELLETGPVSFRAVFCGPRENVPLTAESLKGAAVYAQPGGGEVDSAWRKLRDHAADVRDWVRGGGHYLGFCLGGYLAAATPGYGLLPGDTEQYIGTRGATVERSGDTVVAVRWRDRPRHMFFQDGPVFRLSAGAEATVLATYENGLAAAVVAPCGAGRVGVVGPHPEATASWYRRGLSNPDGINLDLGYDLVQATSVKPPG